MIRPDRPPPSPLVLRVEVVALTRVGDGASRPTGQHTLGRITLTDDARYGWRRELAAGLREAAAFVDEAPVTPTDRRELVYVRHRAEFDHYPDAGDDVRFLLRLLDRLAPDLEEDA